MRLCLVLVCAWLLPGTAAADAIGGPRCPDGGRHVRFGHGTYCAPAQCDGDADCRGERGTSCVEASLCVVHEMATPPSGRVPGPRPQRPRDRLIGACAADGTCGAGQCRPARYCMRAAP